MFQTSNFTKGSSRIPVKIDERIPEDIPVTIFSFFCSDTVEFFFFKFRSMKLSISLVTSNIKLRIFFYFNLNLPFYLQRSIWRWLSKLWSLTISLVSRQLSSTPRSHSDRLSSISLTASVSHSAASTSVVSFDSILPFSSSINRPLSSFSSSVCLSTLK